MLPVAFLGIVVALKNAADIEDDDIVSSVRSVGFYEELAGTLLGCKIERSWRLHTNIPR